ncbi:MAG: efflux RND transporter permease subunit, partial [Afipia birgiae]|nr:efflux RND transporter permease subunit [Afipia birgiae]
FLQTWRASIIPLISVPVSIIGTFAVLLLFGYSINALSLFGLVLAIGIVVDDAIVVVENVERNIEEGLSPRDATYRAMNEVSGPIIAIALVLVAVFVPLGFISGLTGQFYKQFAMTIAISTVISAINSLTLSPALAALLLKGHDQPKDALSRGMDKIFGGFFRRFNNVFLKASNSYSGGVKRVISRKAAVMGVYLVLIGVTAVLFRIVPGGFVPLQDKQYLIGFAQLQEGATLDRTEEIMRQMSAIAMQQPGVESAVAFPGLSINGFTNSSSAGIVFSTLKPFGERKDPSLSATAIAAELNKKYTVIQDAFVAMLPPPPVDGLGTTGGFKLQLEDQAGLGYEALDDAKKAFLAKAAQAPELTGLFSSYKVDVPQLYADIDRTRARQLNVPITSIFETLQVYLGSYYVNDFNKFGRVYSVRVQADGKFRARPEDVGLLKVRSTTGEMIPLSVLLRVQSTAGPESAMRYNGFLAADINGDTAPGYSTGQSQAAVARIAKETLPKGIGFEWTDLTYQEIIAGNTSLYIFPIVMLLVFLVLAAQYESLVLPIAIIMIVPMSLLAAMFGVWITGNDNNIFTQIGLFVLVGLSAKNAILIVEFARELEFAGRTPIAAAIEASRLRLRPILMTSIAFIMGVVPLVTSVGAGAEMRHAMGIAVFSGMIGVTAFGIFFTPVFYVLLRGLTGNKPLAQHGQSSIEPISAAHAPHAAPHALKDAAE